MNLPGNWTVLLIPSKLRRAASARLPGVAAVVLALTVFSLPASAQRFSFMVTGDGRSREIPRRGVDHNGINTNIMTELVQEAVRKKPQFLMFSGDLVLGYTSEDHFRSQLSTWLNLMKPVYDAGIRVYLIRGNHDATSTNAAAVWKSVFTGPYAMPNNGPAGEEDMTWSAVESNALLIGLDDWGSHPYAVNQVWLDRVLATNTLPHLFVMGHAMAFMSGHHTDNLDNHEAARDAFVESIGHAGARTYFAGHDHFYDHMEIHDQVMPGIDIHQFVVGTAGAPFYTTNGYGGVKGTWGLTQIKHIGETPGYLWVEVDGVNVSINFFGKANPGDHYQVMDGFHYIATEKK